MCMTPDAFPPPGFIPTASAVPGIEVYKPAPVDAGPQQEVVDFKCPQCGAVTAYGAADGGLTCTHCGYYEAPQKPLIGRGAEQFEFTVDTLQQAAHQDAGLHPPAAPEIPGSEAPAPQPRATQAVAGEPLAAPAGERPAQGWGEARTEMACQNCGAVSTIAAADLSYTCPFCGSNKVLQRQAPQDVLRPRFVIPFKIEAAACDQTARQWLGSSWMVPADLRERSRLGGFKGIYLPYWTFDADTRADWQAEVGHQRTERYYQNGEWKERTVIEWRHEAGRASLSFDDLLVPGTDKLSRLLLEQIGSFDLNGLCPYESKYLAGFQAQAYDVPLEKAWEGGRQRMREQTRQACLGQASTSRVRNLRMELDFASEEWRYILLPVYVMAYAYSGKTYQAMINGQTGAIAGQRPVDWNKIWLVIAVLLAPGALLGLLGLITIPLFGAGVGIGAIGFVLLVIGAIISIVLYTQASKMDDI